MKLKQLYSGSSGNLYVLTASNGKRLMIECGVKFLDFRKAVNFDYSGIEGCLASHRHKDHCQSLSDVMNAGIAAYALADVFESQGLQDHHNASIITAGQAISLGTFQVYAFELHHDVPILGFVIKCDGEYLLFATDTAFIEQEIKVKIKDELVPCPFSIIAIECSFDRAILDKRVAQYEYKVKHGRFDSKTPKSQIHPSLAKRLWDSHMEKDNTLAYVRDKCNLKKCREVHLLHMSGGNLDKNKTIKEFNEELFIKTLKVGM